MIDGMKTFAFIFARGGSKGLPGKNTKLLLGKPLIAHTIELARSMPTIERVIVSTDSEHIADVAKEFGALVPFIRPDELATDTASEWHAWQHAVDYIQTNIETFDCFVSLPATAPCREVNDVKATITQLQDDVDMVVTASKSNHHPSFNMLKVDESGFCSKFIDTEQASRRQDVLLPFNMTTVAYVSRPEFIMSATNLWEGKLKMQEVNALNAIDIDDANDFKLAELILRDRLG